MNQPEVCIIMLNWNGLADTVECLESLLTLSYPNYRVIVVDNGSQGDDGKVLKQRFGDYIHLIQNDKNYGFAEGNNIGMRYALTNLKPDYYMLLNNDTVVAPDFVDKMVAVGEGEPQVGILGPKIYYHDVNGRKNIIWSAGGKIRWWRPWIYDGIGNGKEDGSQYQGLRAVAWVSGAALMFKREVLEQLSFLNANYFSGNEDVEYCLKARRYGFKVVYVPTAKVWHKVGRARPHPTSISESALHATTARSRRKRGRRFADLPPYYRLLRRNFPTRVYVYHLLILPLLLCQRGAFWLMDTLKPRKVEARESSQAN